MIDAGIPDAKAFRLAKLAEDIRFCNAMRDLQSDRPEVAEAAERYIDELAEDPGVKWRNFSPLRPLPEEVLKVYLIAVEYLSTVPLPMRDRGFTLEELRYLKFATSAAGGALFPLTTPDGQIVAIKVRNLTGWRYHLVYAPNVYRYGAWFSPNFMATTGPVLICEGEFNAMACWLACPESAVMGCGYVSTEPLFMQSPLKGRRVYLYTDANAIGTRRFWAKKILEAGAVSVQELEPWELNGVEHDACEIAGRLGRPELRRRLLEAVA